MAGLCPACPSHAPRREPKQFGAVRAPAVTDGQRDDVVRTHLDHALPETLGCGCSEQSQGWGVTPQARTPLQNADPETPVGTEGAHSLLYRTDPKTEVTWARKTPRMWDGASHPGVGLLSCRGGVCAHARPTPSFHVGGRLPTGDGRPLRGLQRDHRRDDHGRRLNRRLGQDVSSKPTADHPESSHRPIRLAQVDSAPPGHLYARRRRCSSARRRRRVSRQPLESAEHQREGVLFGAVGVEHELFVFTEDSFGEHRYAYQPLAQGERRGGEGRVEAKPGRPRGRPVCSQFLVPVLE
jgi:hypothetical protein